MSDAKKLSPMMQQFEQAKIACGNAVLLFRMGDFYELFRDDAKIAAKALGLTLTSRDKNSANPVPMAGFPHHQLDGYLAKLIRQGHRVAVCEQVEDPATAKGLVKREVTRVVSPGTITDHELLDPRESNFLVAIVATKVAKVETPSLGVAWIDISTGEFVASQRPIDEGELIRCVAVHSGVKAHRAVGVDARDACVGEECATVVRGTETGDVPVG